MKWSFKDPSAGDMIRVKTGTIYHFGIYVSDDEVIQFGLPPSRRGAQPDRDVEVLSSDIDSFLAGGFLEVAEFDRKERKKNRAPSEVIEYARGKLGTRGYHILYNNCEHFANECISGEKICRQAEDLRALFRSMPIVDVYIAPLPDKAPDGSILSKERNEEISGVTSERVRREKHFVWKLLTYALERSFGMHEKALEFTKEESGAWSVKGAFISLSHSSGALAVAVSRAAVGIDIELIEAPKSERMAERITTEMEYSEYTRIPEEERVAHLIGLWTAKEAIFKTKHEKSFIPRDTDTHSASFKTDRITVDGKEYVFSVATDTPERIRIFKNIEL